MSLEELRQILQNCGKSLRASDFKSLLDWIVDKSVEGGLTTTDPPDPLILPDTTLPEFETEK